MVDSPDLSLNISRELLQHDRQLKVIAGNLEKKIKSELAKMLKDEREAYETFWKNFGRQLKYGVVSEYGAHKDLLQDLLLFWSSTEKKLVTLDEYVSRMKEDQKVIYYAAGDTVDKIDKLPQLEALKDQGVEILYFTRGSGRVRGPDPADLQGQGVPLRHGRCIRRVRSGKGQGGRRRP